MSELNKNKYLDFSGLQTYDGLIKGLIESNRQQLAASISELNAKIGNLDVEGSDDKTLADIVSDIYASIDGILAKQGKLDEKDAEIEAKITEEIAKVVGDSEEMGEGVTLMTLVEIANNLKSISDSVSKNTQDITDVTNRVTAVEEAVEKLGDLGDGNTLGDLVSDITKNTQAIEILTGEGEGSVKKAAADAQTAAEATAAADATSKADAALASAKEYVDGKVDGKFDAAGSAAAAQAAAEATAAADATSKADAALASAKEYADGLVKDAEGNDKFDAAGSADAAETAAKGYADSLATNYDAAGSAADAQAAAEATAKAYADGLVQNEDGTSKFDAAGSAAAAETAAKGYADEKAGANTELINGLTDRIGTLEGISHAANVVYDDKTKFINIVDANGNKIGAGFDASPFIVDGMLDAVDFEMVEGVKTNNLVFTFNTAAGKETIKVDFTKYVDTYHADGSSIELNSSTNTFSVKNVEATKTTLTSSIEVNGGPLANDSTEANDKWPDDWYENGVKVIPSGKSMEEILTSLFLKVTNGTVSKGSITWSPSLSAPSVSITQSGEVEVGTKLTATANTTNTVSNNSRTCIFTCKPGHFLSTGTDSEGNLVFGSYVSGNKTVTANAVNPSYDGTPSIKTYWNGTEVTNVNGTSEYTVSIVGTNTFKVDQSGVTAYAGAFDDITVYGSTNTKVPVKTVKASITGDTAPAAKPLTSTASKTVTGARAYWMGAMATPLSEFTSASIREAGEDAESGLVKTLGATPATTLSVPAGQYDVVIATQKEISVVTSAAQFGSAITGNFTANHTEVNIEGANGFTAVKYHVYHCNASWDDDTLTITYK